jgi:tRNA pseudouridine65 synthase
VRGWPDEKMTINSPIKNDESGKYQTALTQLNLLESVTFEKAVVPYPTSRYSLVTLEPKTGRTHQLRKHMNKIAHPIIGDPKHGNRHHNHAFQDWFGNDKLFLHAQSISFEHPETHEKISVTAPLPTFWPQILSQLGFKTTFDNNQK